MNILRNGKSKAATIVALIAAVLCAVIAAFAGVFGGFGAGVQTADASASGVSGGWGTYDNLNSAGIRSCMAKMMGSSGYASYNDLKIHMDKDSDHAKTCSEIYTYVSFGGYTWNVVYVSETRSGDVIATLWLAEGTVVKQWNTWYGTESNNWDTPSNMYSSSLIRHYLVGSPYYDKTYGMSVSNESELKVGTTESRLSDWKTFLYYYDKFIVTPSEVAWQENNGINGATMTANNEAYGPLREPNFSAGYDYSLKPGYNAWMYDKLWLPSAYEVFYGSGTAIRGNLWGVSDTVRKAIASGNGYGTHLRSGSGSNATSTYYLSSDGSSVSSGYATNSNYVRPAIHVNLKTLSQAAGLFMDKPTFFGSPIKTFSTSTQTVTLSSADNMTITLPTGWTRSGTTITIPASTSPGTYELMILPTNGYGWTDGSSGYFTLPIQITATSIAVPTFSGGAASLSYTYSEDRYVFGLSSTTGITVTLPGGWTTIGGSSGEIPARTLPGQYEVIVKPNAGYCWQGGGMGPVALPVTITATQIAVPTLSSTSVSYATATVTMSSYSYMKVTLPDGWQLDYGTIRIPSGAKLGKYEVRVKPNAGYMWQGGGMNEIALPLTINYTTYETPSLSKTSTEYSTSAQTFTMSRISGGTVTLPKNWSLSNTTVTIPAGTPSGTYTITVGTPSWAVFQDGTTFKSYSFNVTPAAINSITWYPSVSQVTYSGSPVTVTASAEGVGNLVVITSGDNLNAGGFTVTAINTNPNYYFGSGVFPIKQITITKVPITAVKWSVADGSGFEYDTQNHAPAASFTASNGQLYSLPVTLKCGSDAAATAVNAGSYTATVPAGTYNKNFSLAADSTVRFTVNPREVQIDWGAETFAYTGVNRDTAVTLSVASGLLGSDTLTLAATYKSGDRKNVTEGGFVMEASIATEQHNYKLPSVITHTYKIAPLTLSEVTAEVEGTYTYNGSVQTPEVSLSGGNIVDGDTVGTFVAGGGIDAGTYRATVIGIDNPNYLLDGTISVQFAISPLDITDIKWSIADGQEFTYNGANRAPEAWFVFNGVSYVLPTDLSEAYDASEDSYVANVAAGIFRNNFNLVDNGEEEESGFAASVSFIINKAKITANDVEWSFTDGFKFAPGYDPATSALFRYDNRAYVLAVSYEDADGVAVVPGGDGSQWVTGVYTATVALGEGAEYGNFTLDGTFTRTFKITESAAGKYTVVWEGFSSVVNYNGANQTPDAYIIVDGEKLGVTVSVEKTGDDGEWTAVSEAKNAGTYRFVATKEHYELDNYTVLCRIDPRVISVSYKNLTGLTHGSVVNVTATTTDPVASAEITAGILNLAVSGSGHVAGTHVVRVEAQVEDAQGNKVKTDNYVISNATAVQTIGKKLLTLEDIEWKLEFVYDGNIKIPEGRVKTSVLTENDKAAGAYVIFEFVYATNVGGYNVKVLGISNENYTYAGEVELVIKELEVTQVKWEGVQDGNSVTYNKQNQMPKPYIEVGGEKIYLTGTLEKYDDVNEEWYEAAYAINAGNFRFTTEEIAAGTGNYFVASAVNNFTIDRYELSSVYLTRNVFTYDGNSPEIEVYAIGANNERIVITNFIVIDKLGVTVASYADAGNYIVQAQMGVLGENSNYTLKEIVATSFIINPRTVTVTFEITGDVWSWKADVETVPTVTVRSSVANAVEVRYGKMGADVNKAVSFNNGISFSFNITGITGDGVITVVASNANYQISGASVQTFNIIPVDGEATASFSFGGELWEEDNLELVYGETDGITIDVSGDNDVEINYYKDGVLLEEAITSVDGLDAGTYLITVNCPTRELSTNVAAVTRTFTILPQEIDFAGVEWLIDGNRVAGDSVKYNGKMYNATLNLGSLGDEFEVYYTNGTLKDAGSVTTTATIISKNANYKAVNVTATYTWTIEPGEDEASTLWILVIVICVLAIMFLLAAFIAAKRKHVTAGDDDGFYDDVSEDEMV